MNLQDRRPYQTVKDFAAKKNLSESAIYKQAEKGAIESKKIGSLILVREKI